MAASALLSAVLGTVSNEAGTIIRGDLKLLWGAKDELESLRNTLSLIQAFLDDAEMKQYREKSVKLWLRNLKDVAYDAQDVIDEAATESLRRRVEAARSNWALRVSSRIMSCASCSTPVPILFNYIIARKIKGIRERLDRIVKEGHALGLQQLISWPSELLEIVARRQPRETSSNVTLPKVVGRTEEMENLVQLLLSSDSGHVHESGSVGTRFSVISIVGMGGLGKTTLAQLVYNDKRAQQHFDARVWVFVSAKFDTIRLISEILEFITKQKPNLTTLDALQIQLGSELSGKRLLLVLDDVWNLELQRWEELCVPLHQAKVGSRVLLTTRNQSNANTVDSMKSIILSALSDDDCWSILQSYAFVDGRPQDHPRLEVVGREIAVKAKGVPLAAKALGGLLKSIGLDENRWRGILESDVSQLREDENGIMPVLRLSYQHLPSHLKQCFAYCAVFPKGFSIDRERLVGMWMALGFIQTQGNERMEDVGSDYFHALLGRSFFQYGENKYSMHDLIHDLAQAVSEGECFVIEDRDMGKVPKEVRHLTLHTIKLEMLEDLHKFKKLRSLLFFCKYKSSFTPVLENLFKKLKNLRVLDLDCYDISPTCDCGFCCCLSLCGALCCKEPPCRHDDGDELPSSIGSLKHLRYLHLYFNDIHDLPESLATLYNLQTLIVAECESLLRLPRGMSNLVNLRQLKANADIVSNIDDIRKLTSLQELQKFSVGRGKGHKIGELSEMNQIRGSLCISKLENVISREESVEAKLEGKRYVDKLELEWSENRDTSSMDSTLDEEVLEGLKPPANLKELVVKNYGGVRSSGWMQNQLPPFLETFLLFKCTKLENFPPLGHLRLLKVLEARGMEGLVQLNDFKGFPSLEKLVFDDMPRWEELSGVEEGRSFCCLRKLVIRNCPKLKGLPTLPPSLSKLELKGVGLCVLPKIWGCPLKSEISCKSSLSSSNAVATVAATTIPPHPATTETTLPSSSSSLPVPEISESPNIVSLFGDLVLHNLEQFNTLKGFLGLPKGVLPSQSSSSSCSSLSTVEISKCPNLRSLREGLLQQDLGALDTLRISDCEGLVDLPEHGLPSPIQLLVIKRCPLLKERCLANGGPDWPKIGHIPYIQIDGVWVKGAEMGGAINEAYEKLKKGLEGFIGDIFPQAKEGHKSESSSSAV